MKFKHLEVIIKKMKYYPLFGLYFISGLPKRDRNLWVFGTYNAGFSDNTKYLYLYLEKNHPEIKIIWITRKKSNLNFLKSKGINAYYKKSIKGILYILRARFIFSNTNIEDVSFWLSKNAIFINLWHGIPLKKIEFDINKGKISWKYRYQNGLMKFIKYLTFPGLYRHPDFVLTPSEFIKKYFLSSFKIEESNIMFGEYPRNSIFKYERQELLDLVSRFESQKIYKLLLTFPKYKKIFIYLPTFRDGKSDFLENSGIDFEKLNLVGKEHNYLFLIKLHPTTSKKIINLEKFENIKLLESSTDIYPILPFTDILISDYSSIFFDYLLINKEIIFFPFDLEEYLKKSREMYFNYDEIVVGKKCNNFEELIEIIKNISNIDFSKQRNSLKEKIWGKTEYMIENNIKFLEGLK